MTDYIATENRPTDPREVESKVKRNEAEAAKFQAESEFFAAQALERQTIAAKAAHEFMLVQRSFDREQRDNDENRVYDFVNEVSRSTCEAAMGMFARWRRESKDPIVIRFSSPGGSVIDGLALYDYIQSIRADGIRVTTCTLGMAASMACILLQAGDVRVIGENAHILIHEISAGAVGKLSDMEDETKFVRRLNDRLVGILASRSKMKRHTIKAKAKRKDWWLASDEVIKYGFADRVGYA